MIPPAAILQSNPLTAVELATAGITSGTLPDSLGFAILDELRDRHPTAISHAVAPLTGFVDSEIDAGAYQARATRFLLETGCTNQEVATQLSPLLSTIETHPIDEERIARLLTAVAVREPAQVARWLPHVLSTEHAVSEIDHARGWALARAAAVDTVAIQNAIPEIDPTPDEETVAIEPVQQLGQIGLVAPRLVEPQLPALLTLAGRTGEPRRAAALRTVGLTIGVTAAGNDRYGLASTLSATTAVAVAINALTAESKVVIEAAADALGWLGTAPTYPDTKPREALLDCLDTIPAATREAVLESIATITKRRPLPIQAIPQLREQLADAPPDEQRQILQLLGEVLEVETAGMALTEAIAIGLESDSHHVRRGAITACERLRSRWETPPARLENLIHDATDDSHRWVRDDAYEALAVGPATARTEAALQTAAKASEHVQTALSGARKLDLPSVTATAIEELTAALPQSTPPGEAQWETDWGQYTRTLTVVAEEQPEHLVPHVETLCSLLETRTAGGDALAAMLRHVATAQPTAVETQTARLHDYCTAHPERPHSSQVFAALLATGWGTPNEIQDLARRFPPGRLAPAASMVADQQPLLVFEMLAALETHYLHDTAHDSNEWWLHTLPDLADATPVVHQPLVDLSVQLLETRDEDWVRWDGAKTLAAVGRTNLQSLQPATNALHVGLDDWNSYVPLWGLQAIRQLPDASDWESPAVQSFRVHPRRNLRREAYTAHTPVQTQSAAPWETAIWAPQSNSQSVTSVIEATSGVDRTAAVATACSGLRAPEPAVQQRATTAIATLVSSTPETTSEALTALAREGSPAEQALAVYTAGEVAANDGEANIDQLRACLEAGVDASPLAVQRWAVRGLGRLASTAPAATATALPTVTAALTRDDDCVRAYAAWTLSQLAWTAPTLAQPAAEEIVTALESANRLSGRHLATALQALPPDALAAVSNVAQPLMATLDTAPESVAAAVGPVIVVLAQAGPESLTPFAEQLGEHIDTAGIPTAIARIAAVEPTAVAGIAERMSKAASSQARRETLAWCGADAYPEALKTALDNGRTSLARERELIVIYLTRAATDAQREPVLEAAMTADNDTAVVHSLIRGLCEMTYDRDAMVRQRALMSITTAVELSESPLDPIATHLLSALLARTDDEDADVRSQAFRSLSHVVPAVNSVQIRQQQATIVAAGIGALTDANGWVYRHAAAMLGQLPPDIQRDANVFQQLLEQCRGADDCPPGVNIALAETASTDGEWATTVSHLSQQLTAASLPARQTALRGLAKVATRRRGAGQTLHELPDDAIETIRSALAEDAEIGPAGIPDVSQTAAAYFLE